MDHVRLDFDCGCFMIYWAASMGVIPLLKGGLSCCTRHEAPNRQLTDLLPITIARIFHDGKPPDNVRVRPPRQT